MPVVAIKLRMAVAKCLQTRMRKITAIVVPPVIVNVNCT